MKSQAVRNSVRKARRQNMVVLLAVVMMGTFSADEARAGRITMSDPQEEITASGVRLCIYSNNIYTFTYMTTGQNCPYTRTFDTEDSE